jgi:hypothetical protein
MWSRKFAAVGLSSATIFAALASFATWYVFYLVLNPAMRSGRLPGAGALFTFTFFFAVGVFAYPACWFWMIQRTRDYGMKRTLRLVWTTYLISCATVIALISIAVVATFGAFVLVAILRALFGSMPPDWPVIGNGLLLIGVMFVGALGGAAYVVMAALITLPVFTAIAIPIAYLHRWILLKMFATNDATALPVNAGP